MASKWFDQRHQVQRQLSEELRAVEKSLTEEWDERARAAGLNIADLADVHRGISGEVARIFTRNHYKPEHAQLIGEYYRIRFSTTIHHPQAITDAFLDLVTRLHMDGHQDAAEALIQSWLANACPTPN